jgi:hypothetical protein
MNDLVCIRILLPTGEPIAGALGSLEKTYRLRGLVVAFRVGVAGRNRPAEAGGV